MTGEYPNLEAMAAGTISGAWREWPMMRPEAKALLAELAALREENARLTSEVERVKLLLGRAAQEINCAGPVDHRIRVMRREHSELVDRLTRERDEARAKLARCVEKLGEAAMSLETIADAAGSRDAENQFLRLRVDELGLTRLRVRSRRSITGSLKPPRRSWRGAWRR